MYLCEARFFSYTSIKTTYNKLKADLIIKLSY